MNFETKEIVEIDDIKIPYNKFIREDMDIDQYAAYLTSENFVKIKYSNNITNVVSYKYANEYFCSWFKSIFGKQSECVKVIKNYCLRAENLSENLRKLRKNLISNEQQSISLSRLEKMFIRYKFPTDLVYDYTNFSNPRNYNKDIKSWIFNIVCGKATNNNMNKNKVIILKKYLDEYFLHVIQRQNNDANNSGKKEYKDIINEYLVNDVKKFQTSLYKKKKIINHDMQ